MYLPHPSNATQSSTTRSIGIACLELTSITLHSPSALRSRVADCCGISLAAGDCAAFSGATTLGFPAAISPFLDTCNTLCRTPSLFLSREADDEAARQSHARACAEENLAAALTQLSEQKVHAQKEAARADDAEAVAAQLREDQSAERAERAGLEVEVERLKVAAKAEADGRAEVEKELREAREEITRLENEREAAAAVSVDGSGSESGNGSGSRRINSLASGTSSLSESGATGDEEERSEASTVGMIDDCGNDNSIDLGEEEEDSSAAEGDERQRRLGSKAASVAAASPALAGSASGEEVEGRDSATSDDPEEDHKSSEILPKKRTRRRLGQVLHLLQSLFFYCRLLSCVGSLAERTATSVVAPFCGSG